MKVSNEFTFSNHHSCFVLFGIHQWCTVLCDMFSFGILCVADSSKMFPVPIFYYILLGNPVITKHVWPLLVTQRAVLCAAYPCPANAIFPLLEKVQTLSR